MYHARDGDKRKEVFRLDEDGRPGRNWERMSRRRPEFCLNGRGWWREGGWEIMAWDEASVTLILEVINRMNKCVWVLCLQARDQIS